MGFRIVRCFFAFVFCVVSRDFLSVSFVGYERK